MADIGKRVWAIAEGYIPEDDERKPREFVSHETACLLNTTDRDTHISIMIYFTDRDPIVPIQIVLAARRTFHLRFNDLDQPMIPRGTEYASLIESDVPIVVQHTRLDSRRVDTALLSTIAYSE